MSISKLTASLLLSPLTTQLELECGNDDLREILISKGIQLAPPIEHFPCIPNFGLCLFI